MPALDSQPRTITEFIAVDADPLLGNPNGPEDTVRRDARIEVMPLMCIGRQRIYLTLIEVESYERERSLMPPSIDADIIASHEAVVAVEEQRRLVSRLGVRAGACALDRGHAGGSSIVEDR